MEYLPLNQSEAEKFSNITKDFKDRLIWRVLQNALGLQLLGIIKRAMLW